MQVNYLLSQSEIAVNRSTDIDLIINFQGDRDVESTSRRPINLSLVLDRSGSMGGSPLRNALKAAEKLVDFLRPEDYLSIVVYDDVPETVLSPQLVSDKSAIEKVIKQIRLGGLTNLSGGWLMGCDHVESKQTSEQLGRVLLLTDGLANCGICDPKVLVKTAAEKAEAGIVTTTLGFGNGFNEDLLIDIAEGGGGNFYFIQSADDAANVFSIEMESLTSIIGQNLTVNLETENGIEVKEVLNKYPTQHKEGVEVFLGDVYQVESKPLVLQFSLPAIATAGETDLGSITYSYQRVVDGSIKKFSDTLPLTINVVNEQKASEIKPNSNVTQQASQLRIAKKKDEAVAIADAGNYQQAAKILRQAVEELKSKALNEYFEIAEEIEQLTYYAKRLDEKRFDLNIRKEMRDQSYQARKRDRDDLKLRGVSSTAGASNHLEIVREAGSGVVLKCDRIKGKLRIRVVSEGYEPFNVQFPRAIREEGASYLVDDVELSANGSFYRVVGEIRRLLQPGEELAVVATRNTNYQKAKVQGTAADLETTDTVGDGVLVQCLKDKSKLRARVVSDGYNPDWNMRFPRSIREEGMMYVVDEVKESSQGGFYLAYGEIKKLVQ